MRLNLWFLLLVVLVVQVWGLYSASPPGTGGVPGLDKVGHLLAFGVPTALAWLLGARWLVWVLLGHALVSEFVQDALAPGRQPDVLDAAANLAGVGLGVLVATAFLRLRGQNGGMPSTADPERS